MLLTDRASLVLLLNLPTFRLKYIEVIILIFSLIENKLREVEQPFDQELIEICKSFAAYAFGLRDLLDFIILLNLTKLLFLHQMHFVMLQIDHFRVVMDLICRNKSTYILYNFDQNIRVFNQAVMLQLNVFFFWGLRQAKNVIEIAHLVVLEKLMIICQVYPVIIEMNRANKVWKWYFSTDSCDIPHGKV